MEVCLLVTASVAVLTGLVGLAHGLLPRRLRRTLASSVMSGVVRVHSGFQMRTGQTSPRFP
jgi:hypothetical protein